MTLDTMDRGLYIAASGMLAEQIRQDQIANDLANAATPGYKADRTAQREFGQLLLANSVTGGQVGGQSTAVQVDAIQTDFTPKPAATRASRSTSPSPARASSACAPPTASATPATASSPSRPRASWSPPRATRCSGAAAGPCRSAWTGGSTRARSTSCCSTNPRKQGDSLVTGTPAGAAGAGQVRAGALEASGADAARSMVDMIASLRSFEAGQRVITTIDETLGRAANNVGSLGS